jgi:hypothetical protein
VPHLCNLKWSRKHSGPTPAALPGALNGGMPQAEKAPIVIDIGFADCAY